MSSTRTPLARVRGLGSAHEGAHHWWMQRLSGAALVPLGLWFAWSMICIAGGGHEAFAAWVARPHHATLLLLLVGSGLYHGWLGVRVVIEDYVASGLIRTGLLVLVAGGTWIAATAGGFSVLKLALGTV